jgi:hypothetical protein
MKFTLLDIVQEILGDMDSDEVNSIDDTVESMQVATIVRSTFYDLAIELQLPEHEGLFELIASSDPDKPTLMTVPETVSLIRSIKYNTMTADDEFSLYNDVNFLPFPDFLAQQDGYRGQTTDVGEMSFTLSGDTFEIMFATNKHPQWFTTVDDHTLIFDSYDSELDTTLQKSKTMCMGVILPTFDMVDTFTPDLDPTQFSLLKNKVRVRAFLQLKQMQHPEAAKEVRKQQIQTQKNKWLAPREHPLNQIDRHFGRKGVTSTSINRRQKQGW